MKPSHGIVPAVLAVLAAIALGSCGPEPPTAATAPSAPAAPAAPAEVSDLEVSQHVQMALQQSPLLQGTEINVVTLKGDIRLTGTLDSQAQIDEALRIARAAEGAHTIHDELTLRKPAP